MDEKINHREIFLDSLRSYFAPLVAVFKAIQAEIKHYEDLRTRH